MFAILHFFLSLFKVWTEDDRRQYRKNTEHVFLCWSLPRGMWKAVHTHPFLCTLFTDYATTSKMTLNLTNHKHADHCNTRSGALKAGGGRGGKHRAMPLQTIFCLHCLNDAKFLVKSLKLLPANVIL